MNAMTTTKFHKSYLRVTAFVIGSFGPIFFLGTMLPTSEPARWTLDFLSFPIDGVQNYEAPTTRFLSALTGGFLFGWGVCIWCLQKWVYDIAPEGVRKSVLAGVLAWFVLDSAGSIASGNASNAIFNIFVLLLAIGPLWTPAKQN
ncbi:MAG: hypothetical protein EAZ08_08820 [Cytophagales bacterium]|nr:MAG: hypothetical protein EAZ08_08820 [Cytophagales bacterium]